MGNACCNSRKVDNTPSDMKDFIKENFENKDEDDDDDMDFDSRKTATADHDKIISDSPKLVVRVLDDMYEEL